MANCLNSALIASCVKLGYHATETLEILTAKVSLLWLSCIQNLNNVGKDDVNTDDMLNA